MFHAKGEQNIFLSSLFLPYLLLSYFGKNILQKNKKHPVRCPFVSNSNFRVSYSSCSSLMQFSHTFLPLICFTVLALPQKIQHGSYFFSKI